jgi:hypothetical protein
MFKTLFPPRIPKATIIGLSLTKEDATTLLNMTHLLITIIYQQIPAIEAFERHRDHGLTPRLQDVQQRQGRFQDRMSDLIKATKDSSQLWPRELMDGQEAILRKVRQCNRSSNKNNLGWKTAALRYWPHIAESYEVLRPTLERMSRELHDAISNDRLWAPGAKTIQTNPQSMLGRLNPTRLLPIQAERPRKTVAFDREVKAQWLDATQEPEKIMEAKGVKVLLTTDKKNTAKEKKFKARRASLRLSKDFEEDEEGEEDGEKVVVAEDVDVVSVLPL